MKVDVKNNVDSSKKSDVSSEEDEESDSFSDDSSSDSKNQKRKIPQFSVLQSDSVGLRMKISAIHKTSSIVTPTKTDIEKNKGGKSSNNNNIRNLEYKEIGGGGGGGKNEDKMQKLNSINLKNKRNKRKLSAIVTAAAPSSSSCCSVCSRSEEESVGSSELINKKDKPKKLRIKRKKVNSEIVHEVKCNSVSSDSECDNNGRRTRKSNTSVLNSEKGSNKKQQQQQQHQQNHNIDQISSTTMTATGNEILPCGGSCISSSDNELPALVNAAIKCVESCSDSENALSIEPKQYTSTLLRDFMAKTQMLGNPVENDEQHQQSHQIQQQQSKKLITVASLSTNDGNVLVESTKNLTSRKKRGRPKRGSVVDNINIVNESADSGITSITQSLSPSPKSHSSHLIAITASTALGPTETNLSTKLITSSSRNVTNIVKENKREINQSHHHYHQQQKLSLENLDKKMYATERVLYPPRDKKKPPLKQSTKSKNTNSNSKDETFNILEENRNNVDPLWKKIDVNMKFRRPSLTGYKSDGGSSTVCSKILAARSGYVSDYGSVGNKNYSGYKSDVSGKSRCSMRSCISRAKSCDYSRSGNSRSKKLGRRRRSSMHQVKSVKLDNEQDILQLAGLSLGQSSEESSRESVCKTSFSKEQSKIYGEINRFVTTGEYFGRSKHSSFSDFSRQTASGNRFIDGNDIFGTSSIRSDSLPFPREFEKFSKRIRSRRSSAVSRCSSYSASTRHDSKRRRRKKFRYKLQSRNGFIDSKLNTEIEILIHSFPTLCKITGNEKNLTGKDREKSEKDKINNLKMQNKRSQKKKKQNDVNEHHHQHHNSNTNLKRRHKKTAHASPDEHKLPLKKRHYLLTPGEKSDGKNVITSETKSKDNNEGKSSNKTSNNGVNSVKSSNTGGNSNKSSNIGGKSGSKAAVTPKKRHLLETTNSTNEEVVSKINSSISVTSGNSIDVKHTSKVLTDECSENASQHKVQNHVKGDTITKKKNRLEGLLSKIQSVNNSSTNKEKDTFFKSMESTQCYPPPGVFEPTVDLELQIPLVKISADGVVTKSEFESPKVLDVIHTLDKLLPTTETKADDKMVETLLNKTGTVNSLKRKRRKPINRTGFPTLKRKKRKIVDKNVILPINNKQNTESQQLSVTSNTENKKTSEEKICDRVPHAGEASDTFLERNKIPKLTVVSLERLQEPQKKVKEIAANEKLTITGTIRAEKSAPPNLSTFDCNNLKNNLRKSPSRTNKVLSSSPNRKKKLEIEKIVPSIDKSRKRTVSQEKRASSKGLIETSCTDKSDGKTSTVDKLTKVSNEKSDVTINEAKNSAEQTNKLSTKRLPDLENKKSAKEKVEIKDNISKNIETEAKIMKNKKKLKKEIQEQKQLKGNSKPIKQNQSISNKKLYKTECETLPKAVHKKTKGKEIDSIISGSFHIEELEQEPLPPLEINEIIDSDEVIDENDSTVSKGMKKITKWKKNYLAAGLFSNYYKVNKSRKNAGINNKPEKEVENINASLLPPPPYCEKFFRRSIEDFLLPYDVWWAYKNSKLPTKAMVPSWNYRKIRTNVYGDVRPNLVFDRQQCICKPQTGCGDDCLNRMVYAECSPANCPCGDKCTNQKIQKHEVSPGTERFMTQNKGWGVRTILPIKKGTYILEYVGEVVTEKEFKERMATLYANDTHHYCLHLDGGLVIDGHRMGSDGRFVNHSCSPNCEMQKWSVNGLSRMALFALRDIEPNEELTYDYNFSLFNPSEGQLCRCETPQCRGVIGGKSQRVKPLEQKAIETAQLNIHSRSRKRQARKNSGRIPPKDFIPTNLQHPSDREKKIIKAKNCFLMRNLEKVRRLKMKSISKPLGISGSSSRPSTPSSLAAHISALLRVQRNIQTRVLTQAVTDPEIEKVAKLAGIFREICVALEAIKDDEDKSLITKLLAASKKKQATQDRVFTKQIDFPTVQANVEKGHYKTPEEFDEDVNSVFANAINYFEPGAEETLIVKRLSKEYTEKKKELYSRLVELIGEKSSKSFRVGGKSTGVYNTHEDVIRCICGLFKDEGLMIQCSKCLVWQHTECTKADVKEENYLCERCEPRKVDLEIPLEEFTEENYRYYLSLLRGDLQVRQGDTVYVLRDIPIKNEDGNILTTKKHTYETIGKIDYSECDIFRVERLWKDDDGKRFIFGHHYLRPHETFHEPSRKFYENEVVRVPLYEVIPIELVIARCWVLDRKTFCMGRPVDCTSEEHVYICELRVNKTARLFAKNKQSYPICTKNYAFRRFKDKLHISKTYAPHDVNPAFMKKKRKTNNDAPVSTLSLTTASTQQQHNNQNQLQKEKKSFVGPVVQLIPPPPKTINEKRTRLENYLKVLRIKHDAINAKSGTITSPLDLSYLLTGRGARQRRANATIVPL